MQIVRMTEREIPQIAGIEQQVFSCPWSEQGFRDTLALANVIFLAAVCDDTVCGYCGIYLAADEGEITNVAVAPEYRREHIGEQLVEELMRQAATQGASQLVLEVRESNQAAIRLYEKLGFESCGIRKNFYEKPSENALVMIYHQ